MHSLEKTHGVRIYTHSHTHTHTHLISVFKSCIQMPEDDQYNQNVVAYIDETREVFCG